MNIPEIDNIENNMIYKAKVCKRCGKVDFCKLEGTEPLDGGFTRYDKWEKIPGWGDILHIGLLCPKCKDDYQRIVNEFMGKKEEV